MASHKVVVFCSDNARIIYTDDVSQYEGQPNALINPDFPVGVPPHAWCISNGKIGRHLPEEINRRETKLRTVDREILPKHSKSQKNHIFALLAASAISACLTGLVMYYVIRFYHH